MALNFKLKIWVDEHANVYAKFGTTNARIRIYRSTTGLVGDRVLHDVITMNDPTTDPPGSALHEYVDSDGQDSYVAWYTFYNDGTDAESGFGPPFPYGMTDRWYVNIQDIRDEGIDSTALSDTRAVKLIRQAQSLIDDATGRHFLPEEKTLKIDSEDMSMLVLPEPIIRVDSLALEELVPGGDPVETPYDIRALRIYNRHLTQRLLRPDDREFPKIMITPEFIPSYRWTGYFPKVRQQFKIDGMFGYTELRPEDATGETTDGSQIPINWGRCPPMLQDVMLRLISKWVSPHGEPDLRGSDEMVARAKSWKTETQAITFHDPDKMRVPVITGDFEVDKTLYRYSRDYSPQVAVIGGRY